MYFLEAAVLRLKINKYLKCWVILMKKIIFRHTTRDRDRSSLATRDQTHPCSANSLNHQTGREVPKITFIMYFMHRL